MSDAQKSRKITIHSCSDCPYMELKDNKFYCGLGVSDKPMLEPESKILQQCPLEIDE